MERVINLIASIITIGVFLAGLVNKDFTFGGPSPSVEVSAITRLTLFLLTQGAFAYLVHWAGTKAEKSPFIDSVAGAWLMSTTILIVAQWATLISLHLYYPVAGLGLDILLFATALLVHAGMLKSTSYIWFRTYR